MSAGLIGKTIFLRAAESSLGALANSTEFGSWFGMKFHGPFTPGARMRGVRVPTTVNAGVTKAQ